MACISTSGALYIFACMNIIGPVIHRILLTGFLNTSFSDHYPIHAILKHSASGGKSRKYVSYRNLSNLDRAKFRNDLCKLRWDSLKSHDRPRTMWNAWNNMFLSVADKNALVRTKRQKPPVK